MAGFDRKGLKVFPVSSISSCNHVFLCQMLSTISSFSTLGTLHNITLGQGSSNFFDRDPVWFYAITSRPTDIYHVQMHSTSTLILHKQKHNMIYNFLTSMIHTYIHTYIHTCIHKMLTCAFWWSLTEFWLVRWHKKYKLLIKCSKQSRGEICNYSYIHQEIVQSYSRDPVTHRLSN